MLVPSKRMFYAVEAVLFIAYNAKSSAVTSREMAERQNLPPRYLEPILQKLVRADILKSVRGPQGGYALARERRKISLADICSVLNDDQKTPLSVLPLGSTILLPALNNLQDQWGQQLAAITIAQLCENAEHAAIPHSMLHTQDFTI